MIGAGGIGGGERPDQAGKPLDGRGILGEDWNLATAHRHAKRGLPLPQRRQGFSGLFGYPRLKPTAAIVRLKLGSNSST